MHSDLIQIMVFAAVAAFVAWKLISVLGTRTGHEAQPQPERDPFGGPAPVAMPSPGPAAPVVRAPLALPLDWPEALKSKVAALAEQDPGFEPASFLAGARKAYGLILSAYWSGDREGLKPLLSDHVLADFGRAIDARGGPEGRRLIALEEAKLTDAVTDSGMAEVTVHFVARIEASGTSEMSRESWTFSRHLRSDDPTWLLVATDSDD